MLRAAERLADSRRGALVLVVVALAVYAAEGVAWPLGPGRDLGVYLRYWIQIGQGDPVFPWAMLSRTPVTPVVAGVLLSAGGGLLAEGAMALLFAGSIVAWAAAARAAAGPRAALLVAVALLVHPGYGGLFHELSSDAVYAAVFALWAYLVARAVCSRTWGAAALAGAGVGLLALTRPASQALVVVAPLLLVVPGAWRARVVRAGAFAIAAVLVLVAWATVNEARYGDFTVARGGQASLPFFRAFVSDRIVSPDNGPASRELAAAVREHLLPLEPYRSYGIDVHRFFSSGSARMEEDLISLSDRVFGWDSNYSVLGRAGREAVRRHPTKYAHGVAASLWHELRDPLVVPTHIPPPNAPPPGNGPGITSETIVVHGKRLPKPSEGEPIPASRQGDYVSTPDGEAREVWRSPIQHGIVFTDPRDARHYERLNERLGELGSRLPDRTPDRWLATQLTNASKAYPPPALWLLVGLLALAFRRPRAWRLPVLLTAASLLVLLVTVLAVYAVPEYSVPVMPSFVVLAAAALLGVREPRTAPVGLRRGGDDRRRLSATQR